MLSGDMGDIAIEIKDFCISSAMTKSSITFASCSVQGQESKQQGVSIVSTEDVVDFFSLTEADRQLAVVNSFQTMHKKISKINEKSASTGSFLITHISKNTWRVQACNLGDDCPIYAFIVDEAEKKVDVLRLTTSHSLANIHPRSEEYGHIRRKSPTAPIDHIGTAECHVSFTRALGGQWFEQFGLSHQPDYISREGRLKTEQHVFVVLGGGGVLTSEDLSKLLFDCYNKEPADIAEIFVKAAYLQVRKSRKYKDSDHDISFTVARVPKNGVTLSAAVFRDHGLEEGNEAITVIEKDFYPCLAKEIRTGLRFAKVLGKLNDVCNGYRQRAIAAEKKNNTDTVARYRDEDKSPLSVSSSLLLYLMSAKPREEKLEDFTKEFQRVKKYLMREYCCLFLCFTTPENADVLAIEEALLYAFRHGMLPDLSPRSTSLTLPLPK